MTITKTENDNTVTLKLDGWLDTVSAPELKKEFEAIDGKNQTLVIDMEKLQYISSAGIRQLVMICKEMRDRFIVKNASVELMDIFHVTGVDRIIKFE